MTNILKKHQNKPRTINDLPDELLIKIFEYATAEDLVMNYMNVSYRWRNLINTTSSIWQGNEQLKGLGHGRSKFRIRRWLCRSPKLKYLELPHVDKISAWKKIISAILKTNHDLEVLHMKDPVATQKQLKALFSLPRLKRIVVTIHKLVGREQRLFDLASVLHDLPWCRDMMFTNHFQMCWTKRDGNQFYLLWSTLHDKC